MLEVILGVPVPRFSGTVAETIDPEPDPPPLTSIIIENVTALAFGCLVLKLTGIRFAVFGIGQGSVGFFFACCRLRGRYGAILNRIVHNAHRIDLTGHSLRRSRVNKAAKN